MESPQGNQEDWTPPKTHPSGSEQPPPFTPGTTKQPPPSPHLFNEAPNAFAQDSGEGLRVKKTTAPEKPILPPRARQGFKSSCPAQKNPGQMAPSAGGEAGT